MLKNLTYLCILAGVLCALIGFLARWQLTPLFVTSRGWLFLAMFCLLAGICFILLSIDQHLEKPD